jgi:imidazolonepropionase
MSARLRILNAAQIVTVVSDGSRFLRGAAQNTVAVIQNGGLVVGNDGKILLCGPSAEVEAATKGWTFSEADMDATGKSVLPGLVDAHSHPVWAGDRCHEFHLKLAGATYQEVAKMGGGIGFTTECTRGATEDELYELLAARLRRMLRQGTTTVEGKSGYGMETATELKMLRVLTRANRARDEKTGRPLFPRIVSTFLGAHAVPKGLTPAQGTRLVVDEMIPAVAQAKKDGTVDATLIDAFCEAGYYDAEQTKEIMLAGRTVAGLEANFHGDELTPMKCGELAGEIGAVGVSHCEHVTPEGIVAMAKRPTFGVLLPSTAYVLRIKPPPARAMIAGGVPIALGSDFCPNAHSLSMPFTMNLACVLMHMTVNEALVASTINAAASLVVSQTVGSLEVGKLGDLVVLDVPLWEHLVYEMVDPPISAVFREGFKMV